MWQAYYGIRNNITYLSITHVIELPSLAALRAWLHKFECEQNVRKTIFSLVGKELWYESNGPHVSLYMMAFKLNEFGEIHSTYSKNTAGITHDASIKIL